MSKRNVAELSGRDTVHDELTELIDEGAGKLIREVLDTHEKVLEKVLDIHRPVGGGSGLQVPVN